VAEWLQKKRGDRTRGSGRRGIR